MKEGPADGAGPVYSGGDRVILRLPDQSEGDGKMEAHINEECIFCGLCADLCPQIFQMGDEQAFVSVESIPEEMEDCCREAAEECPTEAIEIRE